MQKTPDDYRLTLTFQLVTVGPNFRLVGSIDVSVTLAARIETNVDIAKWEIQQTLPDPQSKYDPQELEPTDRSGTGSFNGIQQPSVYAGVNAK
ncbi:hypothetical protein B0A49_12127, partial [Cryomyces minteri]